MDNIEHLDAYVSDKPIDMEADGENTDYINKEPMELMLREERTHQEPNTIVETVTELKNWAWERAAHPMEDFLEKIKTVEPLTPTKNIISIPIKSVSTSIVVPIKSICDRVPIESVPIESVKNSIPYNVISGSAYLLALNVFISKIGKETFNNEELKQGCVEPIKEETQPVNLRTDDEPKMVQMGNTLTFSERDALVALLTEFKEVFAWSYKDMPEIYTDIVQHCISTDLAMKPVKQKLRRMKPEWTLKIKEEVEKQYNAGFFLGAQLPKMVS